MADCLLAALFCAALSPEASRSTLHRAFDGIRCGRVRWKGPGLHHADRVLLGLDLVLVVSDGLKVDHAVSTSDLPALGAWGLGFRVCTLPPPPQATLNL